jgi:hypothetical protein
MDQPPKPYRDFKTYLRERFGATVHKLPVDAGFTCPNRDGRLGTGGCSYCDGRGSRLRQAGPLPSVADQVRAGMAHYRRRGVRLFIPYFQTFTNTDAPPGHLRRLYDEALSFPDTVGLAVGTRPDCLPPPVVALLASYLPAREVWVELGVQSMHDRTLEALNRCHTAEAVRRAVRRAAAAGLRVCAHVILGLPGETPEEMRETARRLAGLPIAGVKIHLLLVLEGTPLAQRFRRGEFSVPTLPEYASLAADFLEILPPGVVIQRLTADGYADVLLAPSWANRKLEVLDAITAELRRRGTRQGSRAAAVPPPPQPSSS